MFRSALTYVKGYFGKVPDDESDCESNDSSDSEATLDPVVEPAQPLAQTVVTLQPVTKGYSKLGKVTAVSLDSITIDNAFTYSLDDSIIQDFVLKQDVSYSLYEREDGTRFVKNVRPVFDELWDTCDQGGKQSGRLSDGGVKRIMATVKEKRGNMLTINPGSCDISCDMDKVSMTFVPIVGDIVLFEALVASETGCSLSPDNVLEIKSIEPLNSRPYEGFITFFEGGVGEIDELIYVNRTICGPTYKPKVGDFVKGEAIECKINNYILRALNVTHVRQETETLVTQPDEQLYKWKYGVKLFAKRPQNAVLENEPFKFEIEVYNSTRDRSHKVNKITYRGNEELEKLTECDFKRAQTIVPGDSIFVHFVTRSSFVGRNTVTVVFSFEGDFEIGQKVSILVDTGLEAPQKWFGKDPEYIRNPLPTEKINANLRQMIKSGEIVPYCKRKQRPRYLRARMDKFVIPPELIKIFTELNCAADVESQLLKIAPCLEDELNVKNYAEKFQSLVFLESIQARRILTGLDMVCVQFGRDGAYLTLLLPYGYKHKLTPGDRLIAKRGEKSKAYEGVIENVEDDTIWITFEATFMRNYDGENYNVNFVFDDSCFGKANYAVKQAPSILGEHLLFPTSLRFLKDEPQLFVSDVDADVDDEIASENGRSNHEKEKGASKVRGKNGEYLPEYHAHEGNKCLDDDIPDSSAKETEKVGIMINWSNKLLNPEQKFAVRNILRGIGKPYPYIIFGPPGTGKTMTIIETILQIKKNIPSCRILVATPSNSSANLICERLLKEDPSIPPTQLVRIISHSYALTGKRPPNLLPYCMYADASSLDDRTNVADPIHDVPPTTSVSLGRHIITVGTCLSLSIIHAMDFPIGHFTHVFVDEAGQASEPDIMVPLLFYDKEDGQLILSGDPKQLGPVIMSEFAKKYGLEESYIARLLNTFPYSRDEQRFPDTLGYDPRIITKLIRNYRSQPDLLKMYSVLYYDNHLIAMTCPRTHQLKLNFDVLLPERKKRAEQRAQQNANLGIVCDADPAVDGINPAVMVHGVRGKNIKDEYSTSWYNNEEIIEVAKYVKILLGQNVCIDDIGVVTPYHNQVLRLKQMMKNFSLELPKIGTVEEFQGQEKPVIIMSTVKSMNLRSGVLLQKGFEFISNKRRLNVAISRAQCLFILVGNPHLLVLDEDWKYILKSCVDNGCYRGCDLPSGLQEESSLETAPIPSGAGSMVV